MEIGPFSWGGNEKQMWLRSWGADSCRVRGLGLQKGHVTVVIETPKLGSNLGLGS